MKGGIANASATTGDLCGRRQSRTPCRNGDHPRRPDGRTAAIVTRLESDLAIEAVETGDGKKDLRLDGAALMVHTAFATAVRDGEHRSGVRAALSTIRPLVPAAGHHPIVYHSSGGEAAALLRESISVLDGRGMEMFGRRLPAYDWLWMIRRLPLRHIWTPSAATSTRAIMTGLALGNNTRPGELVAGGLIAPTSRHGRSLAFLHGYASVLSELVIAYRWVGKGGHVTLDFAGNSLSSGGSEELRGRLAEYDARVLVDDAWGGFGVRLPEISRVNPQPERGEGPILLLAARSKPEWVGPDTPTPTVERYVERFAHLEEVFTLLAAPHAPGAADLNPEMGVLLPLLATYPILYAAGSAARQNARSVGYSVLLGATPPTEESQWYHATRQAIEWAKDRLPGGMVPGTPEEMWARLVVLRPSVSPIQQGPVIVTMPGQGCIVDWAAATARFIAALRYPKLQGNVANLRAAAFEESVRAAVGQTVCAPSEWLQELIGRHLALNHVNLSEIDAAATLPCGKVHLVVSCKSYQYTEEYERGDFNAVRNVNQRLLQDLVDWITFVRTLNTHRVGDNYRISDDAYLVPIVVTPRVLFVENDVSSIRVLHEEWGPRLVSSVGELVSVLSGWAPEEYLEPE